MRSATVKVKVLRLPTLWSIQFNEGFSRNQPNCCYSIHGFRPVHARLAGRTLVGSDVLQSKHALCCCVCRAEYDAVRTVSSLTRLARWAFETSGHAFSTARSNLADSRFLDVLECPSHTSPYRRNQLKCFPHRRAATGCALPYPTKNVVTRDKKQ